MSGKQDSALGVGPDRTGTVVPAPAGSPAAEAAQAASAAQGTPALTGEPLAPHPSSPAPPQQGIEGLVQGGNVVFEVNGARQTGPVDQLPTVLREGAEARARAEGLQQKASAFEEITQLTSVDPARSQTLMAIVQNWTAGTPVPDHLLRGLNPGALQARGSAADDLDFGGGEDSTLTSREAALQGEVNQVRAQLNGMQQNMNTQQQEAARVAEEGKTRQLLSGYSFLGTEGPSLDDAVRSVMQRRVEQPVGSTLEDTVRTVAAEKQAELEHFQQQMIQQQGQASTAVVLGSSDGVPTPNQPSSNMTFSEMRNGNAAKKLTQRLQDALANRAVGSPGGPATT